MTALHRHLGFLLPLLLLAACGQTAPSAPGTSPSGGALLAPTPTPTPLFGFPVGSGVTCPNLSSLGGGGALLDAADQNPPHRRDVILCDAADPAHPRSLQALIGSANQTFLSKDLI